MQIKTSGTSTPSSSGGIGMTGIPQSSFSPATAASGVSTSASSATPPRSRMPGGVPGEPAGPGGTPPHPHRPVPPASSAPLAADGGSDERGSSPRRSSPRRSSPQQQGRGVGSSPARTPPPAGAPSDGRRSSSSRNLPALFVLIEQNEWARVAKRVRKHPREAAAWASVRKASSGGSGGGGGGMSRVGSSAALGGGSRSSTPTRQEAAAASSRSLSTVGSELTAATGATAASGGKVSTVRCKALHHACQRLRSVHSLPVPPAAALRHSWDADDDNSDGGSKKSEEEEKEPDPWVAACRAIVALVEAHPKAAGERESRHGCLPLHLAAFGMSSSVPLAGQQPLLARASTATTTPGHIRAGSGGRNDVGDGSGPVDLDAVLSADADDEDDDSGGQAGGGDGGRRAEVVDSSDGGVERREPSSGSAPRESTTFSSSSDDDAIHPPPPHTPRRTPSASASAPTSPAVDVDECLDELSVPLCRSDPVSLGGLSGGMSSQAGSLGLAGGGGGAAGGVGSSGRRPPRGHGRGGTNRPSSLGSHDMSLMGMSAMIASELAGGRGGAQQRQEALGLVSPRSGISTVSSVSPSSRGGGGRGHGHVRHHSHDSRSAALTGISGRIDEEMVGERSIGGSSAGGSGPMAGMPPHVLGGDGGSNGRASSPPLPQDGGGAETASKATKAHSRSASAMSGTTKHLRRPSPLKTSARAQSAPVAVQSGGGVVAIGAGVVPAMTPTSINATRRDHHSLLVINALLDAYPRAIKTDSEGGRLPLHTAVSGQATPKVIRTLIRAYPDATRHRTKDGYLPLHLAAHWGISHPDVVQALLRAYPDAIVGRNRWERTPLEEALVMAGENGRAHQTSLVRALRRHPSYWAGVGGAGPMGGMGGGPMGGMGGADNLDNLLSPESAGTKDMKFGYGGKPGAGGRPRPPGRPSSNVVDVDDMSDDSDDDSDYGEGGQDHAHAHGFMSRISPRHLLRNKSAASQGSSAKGGKAANAAVALAESKDLPTLIRTHAFHSIPHRVEIHPAEAAAPINATVRGGYPARATPLYLICERNPPIEAVEALVEAYPEATAARKVPGGQLPLHAACTWNASPAVVGHLLAANPSGAKTRDDLSNLPLHCACFSGCHIDTVESLLCTYPRAVWVPNGQGSGPADIVRRLRHPNRREVLDLIARHEKELVNKKQRSKDRSRSAARCAVEQSVEAVRTSPSPARSKSGRGGRVSQSPVSRKVELKVSGDDDDSEEGMLWV